MVALLLVATAATSFAQINVSLTPDPNGGEIQTNRHAGTASADTNGAGVLVSGQIIANSVLTATTLRITYPGPFTSSSGSYGSGTGNAIVTTATFPATDPIRIEGASGVFANMTNSDVRVNTGESRIEIALPASTNNTQSGSFRIVGVRIDANGKTGAQTVTAALSSSANNYLLTTPGPLTVINNLGPGINAPAVGSAGGHDSLASATIYTNRTVPDSTGSFIITEGIAAGWRTKTGVLNNGGSNPANGTNIRLTFNGVPQGVTLSLTAKTNQVGPPLVTSIPTFTLSNSTITANNTMAFRTRWLPPFSPCVASVASASTPPSPLLSARMMSMTYLSDTTNISAHRIVETPPMMLADMNSTPCAGLNTSLAA